MTNLANWAGSRGRFGCFGMVALSHANRRKASDCQARAISNGPTTENRHQIPEVAVNAAGVERFEGAGKFLAYAFMVSERLMYAGIAKCA